MCEMAEIPPQGWKDELGTILLFPRVLQESRLLTAFLKMFQNPCAGGFRSEGHSAAGFGGKNYEYSPHVKYNGELQVSSVEGGLSAPPRFSLVPPL